MIVRRLPIADMKATRAYIQVLISRHRLRFVITMALAAAAALAALVTPYLLGVMTEDFTAWIKGENGDPVAALNWQTLAILVAVLAQAGLTWASYRNLTALSEQFAADLREDFMEWALRMPQGQIEAAGTGELLSRTSLDVNQVQQSIIHAAPQFFSGLITVLLFAVGGFVVSPVLGILVLVAAPPVILVLRWYFARSSRAFHAVQAARSDLTAAVVETIDGLKAVESLGWQSRRLSLTDAAIDDLLSAQQKTIGLRRVLFPVLDFSAFLPCVAVLLVGGLMAANGIVSLGEVTTVVLITHLAVAPMTEMILSLEFMQVGGVSLARLVGIRTSDQEARPADPSADSDEVIELKGVDFGYGEQPVLRGVDLALRRGERLALVGPTGAGKSTLARLMAGIYSPDRGTVYLGCVDERELCEEVKRRFVMVVTQEFHLFNDTLASNLRLGAPEASDAEMLDALEAVGALSLVTGLPEGLRTRIGGRDHELTPAEVQQVALARVVLASPEVIVLDEATSMLSPNAASEIEQGLSRLLSGRTVVSIAHRLHSARDADRIAVVERGQIAELGTHEELLARQGSYAALWRSWNGLSR